jgi:hypothetical protein
MTVKQLEEKTESIKGYIKKLEIIGILFCLTTLIFLTMIQNKINTYGSVSTIFFMLFIAMMTTHFIEEKKLKKIKCLKEEMVTKYTN